MAAGLRATTIDWSTTTISAVSFLAHFGLLAAIYSDWCDPVVVDDEVARTGAVQALMTLAPPPPTERPVEETLGPPLRPFVPMDPGRDTFPLLVDQPTDPDWSDLDALTLTDPANAGVVKRAKAFRASLDAKLFGSRTSGAEGSWHHWTIPQATAQSVRVTGGVSNAARVVAGMRAGFRACYQRGLRDTPQATGSLRLTLRVGAEGQVVEAAPVASGNLSEAVILCATARARAALFDAPEEGSASIDVRVAFRP